MSLNMSKIYSWMEYSKKLLTQFLSVKVFEKKSMSKKCDFFTVNNRREGKHVEHTHK